MKIKFKEIYPTVYPHYQLVGDEDEIFIFAEWVSEQINKAVFDMLKTPANTKTIWKGPEIKV